MKIDILTEMDGLKCDYECPFLDTHEGKCLFFNKVLIHPSRYDFDGFETCEECRHVTKKQQDIFHYRLS